MEGLQMRFEKAKKTDLEEIRAMYREAIGSPGCTWSAEYPSMEDTLADYERGDLFCLKTETQELVGAISVDADPVVDAIPCWNAAWQPSAELSRLVVKESFQKRGIAKRLLQDGMRELKGRGCKSVHFLVSKTNERAIRAYAPLEFAVVGEWNGFGQEWFCYEKPLNN